MTTMASKTDGPRAHRLLQPDVSIAPPFIVVLVHHTQALPTGLLPQVISAGSAAQIDIPVNGVVDTGGTRRMNGYAEALALVFGYFTGRRVVVGKVVGGGIASTGSGLVALVSQRDFASEHGTGTATWGSRVDVRWPGSLLVVLW